MGIYVTFWGVRGSIPTPGHATQRYGGNTACIEVQAGEELFILMAALDPVVSVKISYIDKDTHLLKRTSYSVIHIGIIFKGSLFHPRLFWQ